MKNIRLNKQNTAGFTMLELMVTVGIISILSVSFAMYLYQQSKQTKAGDSALSYSKLQNTILTCAGSSKCLKEAEALGK